jgi:hypothetical protein
VFVLTEHVLIGHILSQSAKPASSKLSCQEDAKEIFSVSFLRMSKMRLFLLAVVVLAAAGNEILDYEDLGGEIIQVGDIRDPSSNPARSRFSAVCNLRIKRSQSVKIYLCEFINFVLCSIIKSN